MCSHSTWLLKECLHFHGGIVRQGWPYVSHLIPHSSLESESLVLTARWSVATQNIKHCFDMETVSELRSACAIILKQIGIFLLHIVKAPSATIYIAGSMSDFFFSFVHLSISRDLKKENYSEQFGTSILLLFGSAVVSICHSCLGRTYVSSIFLEEWSALLIG